MPLPKACLVWALNPGCSSGSSSPKEHTRAERGSESGKKEDGTGRVSWERRNLKGGAGNVYNILRGRERGGRSPSLSFPRDESELCDEGRESHAASRCQEVVWCTSSRADLWNSLTKGVVNTAGL